MPGLVVAAVAVVAVVAVGVLIRFEIFCLTDLAHAPDVRVFPREVWALLIVMCMPIGGLFYLRYGRIG